MKKSLFVSHYEFLLIASHTALMAGFIFLMHLARSVQLSLLIASGLVFGWAFHSRGSDEPPCGADIGSEAIARPRPGFEP